MVQPLLLIYTAHSSLASKNHKKSTYAILVCAFGWIPTASVQFIPPRWLAPVLFLILCVFLMPPPPLTLQYTLLYTLLCPLSKCGKRERCREVRTVFSAARFRPRSNWPRSLAPAKTLTMSCSSLATVAPPHTLHPPPGQRRSQVM